MSDLIVSNTNILVETFKKSAGRRPRCPGEPATGSADSRALLRRVQEARKKIRQIACSSTWAEDCLCRGADYCPDLECQCPLCREKFPARLYPRPVAESAFSADCQVESETDAEFADDVKALRNDRPRIGSVFLDARVKFKTRRQRKSAKSARR